MKTCEEYVLKELEAAKAKICELEKENEEYLQASQVFMNYLHVLKKYMHEAEGPSGLRYIFMNYVFDEHEKEDFEFLRAGMAALEDDKDDD